MPLPSSIAKIKIHPAVGFARLSSNPDHFVFGETITKWKSNDRIKRQAVQFRLFAYDAAGNGLEELTTVRLNQLGLVAQWSAEVANKKISSRPTRDNSFTITASARSNDPQQGRLFGRCGDFQEGQNIPLGQIMPDGKFFPPVAGAFRRDARVPIPDAAGLHSDNVADNTCDGLITAEIAEIATGQLTTVPIAHGWVFVTPPDFAPDWDDDPSQPPGHENLLQVIARLLALPNNPPATPVNQTARRLDQAMLRTGTGDFAPGIELNPLSADAFQPPAETGDPDEVRVRLNANGTGGTTPGDMSSGLCSPWQYDFKACTCSYWPNQRPDVAFKDNPAGPSVNWRRKGRNDVSPNGPRVNTNPEYIEHVFKLGIIRKQDGVRVETERSTDIP